MNLLRSLPIARYHLFWLAFYLVLLGGGAAYAAHLYEEYNEDLLPSGHIELELDKDVYEVGEAVAFTVRNHFPTTVYVANHCPNEPLNVYRRVHDSWVALHATARENAECYGQERSVAIPPSGSRSYDFGDWPDLFQEPGVYRIAMVVDGYLEIPFRDFRVVVPRAVTPPVVETEAFPAVPVTAPPSHHDVAVPDVRVEPQTAEEEELHEENDTLFAEPEHKEREWEHEEEEEDD